MIIKLDFGECQLAELTHTVCFSGADNIIIRLRLLQHQAHCAHIIRRMPPVTPRIEIPYSDFSRQSHLDARNSAADLPRDKFKPASWPLVVEQYTAAAIHS